MSKHIAHVGIGLLVACVLAASTAHAYSDANADRPPAAGPWYTPRERAALDAYSKATFAEKKEILRGATPRTAELYDSRDHASDGRPLRSGVTYHASRFPILISVRPNGGLWEGSQFVHDTGPYENIVLAGRKVGFVELTHKNTRDAHGRIPIWTRGLITIETTFAPSSARATMARLRARLGDVDADEVEATQIAGFQGLAYDGRVTGTYHRFVPFSASDGSKPSTDSIRLFRYQRFRVIVLDVRGQAVVVYLQSAEDVSKSAAFPSFIPFAHRMLASLRFPK